MKQVRPKYIDEIFNRWKGIQLTVQGKIEEPNNPNIDLESESNLYNKIYSEVSLDLNKIIGWMELELNKSNRHLTVTQYFERIHSTIISKSKLLEEYNIEICNGLVKLRHLHNEYVAQNLKIAKTYEYADERDGGEGIPKNITDSNDCHIFYSKIRETQIKYAISRAFTNFYCVLNRLFDMFESHEQNWRPHQDNSHKSGTASYIS